MKFVHSQVKHSNKNEIGHKDISKEIKIVSSIEIIVQSIISDTGNLADVSGKVPEFWEP
jgi:hypothetical protein